MRLHLTLCVGEGGEQIERFLLLLLSLLLHLLLVDLGQLLLVLLLRLSRVLTLNEQFRQTVEDLWI